MAVLVLHFSRFLDNVLQLLLLETFVILDPLLPELLQARRRNEHHVRLQVRISKDLQALRMEIKNTDFTGVHDGPYCLHGGAVVGFLVFTVFDELPTKDVGLELGTRDEMVVLAVHFRILPRATRVLNKDIVK